MFNFQSNILNKKKHSIQSNVLFKLPDALVEVHEALKT